jgi:hypothetical protein
MIRAESAQIAQGPKCGRSAMSFKSELAQLIRKHLTGNLAAFGDYMEAAVAMEEAKNKVDLASDTRFTPHQAIAWEDLEIAKANAAERFALYAK